jgi:hypothetical protein
VKEHPVRQSAWPRELDGLPHRSTDWDFLVGEWTVHNRRLSAPLAGSDEWYETEATAASTTLQNGAVSIDEMWFAEQGFAGTTFRVHDRQEDTWSIYWIHSDRGHLEPPVTGKWSPDGARFEGYGREPIEGREVLVRFLWHSISATTATWEQAFSLDDGTTWETNWVMSWTRPA